ncbi:MAG: hypothetical protein ACM3YE_12895 [Bacteroidota bacterium]
MKLKFIGLAGLILLAIIPLSWPDLGIDNNIFEMGLPKPDFNWVENYVDGAVPVANSFIKCFVKAGLLPTPYDNYFTIRHVPPVWEKTLSEYISFLTNFFRPIMVLIIFLFFYQSSRNSAGLDHLTGLCRQGV